jgi:ankyrin repeat protein
VRYHEEVWGGVPVTAFVLACEGGHAEVARLLLEHGGETKQELEAALRLAAEGGHAEIMKMLMERGADPCARENLAVR